MDQVKVTRVRKLEAAAEAAPLYHSDCMIPSIGELGAASMLHQAIADRNVSMVRTMLREINADSARYSIENFTRQMAFHLNDVNKLHRAVERLCDQIGRLDI
jgi:hypothetical protein